MQGAIGHAVRELAPSREPAKTLYWSAAFWLTSGAIHTVALAFDGWRWSGAVSFRKPVVFSISIGLLLGTAGWVLDRLPDRRVLAGALAWTFSISSSVEVSLIALQAWRGRASHFNVFQAGDAAIFAAMGVAVGVMSLCLVGLLIWSIVEPPADPPIRIAVIAGLALVMAGLGLGQWMIELGNDFVAANRTVPEVVTYRSAGHPKFPHALAFHGIQLFIVAGLFLERSSGTASERSTVMGRIVWSYVAILLMASVQAVLGLSPATITPWTLGMAVAGVVMIGSGLSIWTSLGRRDHRQSVGVR